MHLFRNKGSKRFRALALTVVVALGVPLMMLDRIVVSGTGIEETGGIVTTRGFHYADVEYVHVTTRPGARARTVTVWEVHYKPDSVLGLAFRRAGRGHQHWQSLERQLGHHYGSLKGVRRPVPLTEVSHPESSPGLVSPTCKAASESRTTRCWPDAWPTTANRQARMTGRRTRNFMVAHPNGRGATSDRWVRVRCSLLGRLIPQPTTPSAGSLQIILVSACLS